MSEEDQAMSNKKKKDPMKEDNDNEEEEEDEEELDNRILEERQRLNYEVVERDNGEGVDHEQARKFTQILAVAAVSFGACICSSTVVYPAVANPSIKASNATNFNVNATTYNAEEHQNSSSTEYVAFLPFVITDDDISFLSKC